MSSEEQNGFEGRENNASSFDTCSSAASNKKTKNLDQNYLFEAFLNEHTNEMHNDSGVLDDFECRFMEQVYKERENSEGWDRYLDILHDGLTSNNDGIVHNLDTHLKTEPGESQVSYTNSKSKTSDNSCPSNGTHQSEQEKHRQMKPKVEQKSVHYFRNGTCYYGNPMKDDKKTEREKKEKPELDASELQFYRNLRAYFRTGNTNSMSHKKSSRTPSHKKAYEDCPPLEKETVHFSKVETRGKSPLSRAKFNGFYCKDLQEDQVTKALPGELQSPKFENISMSQAFAGKEPITQSKKEKDYSDVYKNTNEAQQGKKTPFKETIEENKFDSGVNGVFHLPKKITSSEEESAEQLPVRVTTVNGLTPPKSDQEISKKSLHEEVTAPSKNDPSISSKMYNGNPCTVNFSKKNYPLLPPEKEISLEPLVREENVSTKKDKTVSDEVHAVGLSNQGYPLGMTSENVSKSSVSRQETLKNSSQKQGPSSTQSDSSLSFAKGDGQSPLSPSSLKASKENSCPSDSSDRTKSRMKRPMTATHGELNDKHTQSSSKPGPSEFNVKNTFSNVTKEKQKTAHKGKEKTTPTSKGFSFVNDKDMPHKQRRPSLEKNEFKSQPDKKTKKSNKANEDAPHYSRKSSSTSRLHKERNNTKQRVSDTSKDFESHFQKVKSARQSKEEMIRQISSNETLDSLLCFQSVKEIGFKCFKFLLWIIYCAILIAAVVILCLFTILKGTAVYVYGYVMSLGVTIAIIDKLWLGKIYLARWYGMLKEFIREKVYGPKRAAQTYNLPNSGEDAVQTLLLRQGADSNPYRILGVPREATDEDIRKQYRKLAVLVHPDKNKHTESARAFQILSSAYDILGDSNKRQQFDREVARKEQMEKDRASGNFMKDPADYADPRDFFADFMKQMEEIRESLSCNACQGRHRRILTERTVYQARFCSACHTLHQAKEGDFWKESDGILGMGPGKFYTRMENAIYDITAWGLCQERCGFHLPADAHRVCGKINSHRKQPPPRQRYTEEDFFRDLFRQSGDVGHGQHNHRDQQQNKNKQQRRRRKKK